MNMLLKKFTSFILIFSFLFYLLPFIRVANAAAQVTSLSDAMSTVKASTTANHTIKFVTPTGIAAGQNVILTFSAGFTGVTDIVHTDVDFAVGDTGNCATATFTEKTLGGSASGSTWSADGDSSTTVTITSGTDTVAAGKCVRIKIGTNASSQATGVHQISNGAIGAADTITVSGTFTDYGTLAVDIISNDVVTVSAVVDPTITFSISDNTIYFGALRSSGSSCWAQGTDPGDVTCPTTSEAVAHTIGVSTNAPSGYVVTMSGATLTSGGNTIDGIGAVNTAPSIGTEQFGVRFTSSGGIGTVTAPYEASGYAFDPSQPSQIASAIGPSATTTYSAYYLANIAPTTEAGSYSTALTYVATATF